jgi:hypothetical protein
MGVSKATVSRVLRRAGLSRLSDLQPDEPVQRYERETPGELLHIEVPSVFHLPTGRAHAAFGC